MLRNHIGITINILLGIQLLVLHVESSTVRLDFGPKSLAVNNSRGPYQQQNDEGFKKKNSVLLSSPKHVINLGKISKQSNEAQNSENFHVNSNWSPVRTMNQEDFSKIDVKVLGQSEETGGNNRNQEISPDISANTIVRLRRILGSRYDQEWTSEIQPRVVRQRGGYSSDGNNELFNAARNLNISLKDHNGVDITGQHVDIFRSWLINMATCEMEYIWEDLGSLFFPRFIRRGVCLNKPEKFCSWPPGMKCRPSGSRALQLLHWKCQESTTDFLEPSDERKFARRNTYMGRFPRSLNSWQNYNNIRTLQRHSRNQMLSPEQVEVRKQRRIRRLIRMTSKIENGKHCFWQVQKILISDSCTCSCS